MYLFLSGDVSVRKMKNNLKDKSLLLEWLTNPLLLELVYGEGVPWNMQKIEDNFVEKTADIGSVVACFIIYEGKEIGYTQYYKIEQDSYKFNEQVPYEKFTGGYGMDIFIGYPHLWGKEIGTKTIKAIVDYLMNTLGAIVVCADPEENNQRSVRCWIKAGFKPMGTIQNYDEPDKSSILMAVFR